MTFGERLRLARESRGMTQVDLAAACHTSQYMVSYWEKQPHAPGGRRLAALCKALGVSPSYLLGLDDEHNGEPAPIDLVSLLRGPQPLTVEGHNISPEAREALASAVEAFGTLLAGDEHRPTKPVTGSAADPIHDAVTACVANYPFADDPQMIAMIEEQIRAAWPQDGESTRKGATPRSEAEQEAR